MSKQSLPGNPHMQGADNGELPYESFAIAQATLALAYEQRTANLIALMADGASGPIPGVDYNTLANQIVARLQPEGK